MSDRPPTIVVIGASAGGIEALRAIVGGLPSDFPAAVFVVVHLGAHKSELPWLLSQIGPLPVVHPQDGDDVQGGMIFVAPPDHHMIVRHGRIRLTKGPRENWARPAIDPLFRSAAESYGAGVVGVILSGGLNDGCAGLYQIKDSGGVTLVQDPADAINPSMPRSAIANVTIDHCLPAAEMPRLLVELVAAMDTTNVATPHLPVGSRQEEVMTAYTSDQPIAVTCPDCGGALRRQHLGPFTQFRCHIGHVYTAEIMLAAQFLASEQSLGAAMRTLRERGELCRQMVSRTELENTPAASAWERAMQEAFDQADTVRQLLEREWTLPDGIGVVESSGAPAAG
ncbi:chemotaxis protein CheB [Bosea sp. 685]|uniref:chemotaxis protein CheB n=1 Tax=Bosea sp. 685 TaxID=3080057 RepID=UPI00289306ED|nr:chemotaxis protein CheB [Bosea sp. 685]WNJ92868.1 chemotaxis protein CheB [Bosea sp. 685]